jgi:hypothetical protein
MPKKSKNRSSKQNKQRRQTKARMMREAMTVADEQTTMASLREAWAAKSFPMVGPDGQTYPITVDQIAAQWSAELASDGEPPVVAEELFDMLEADVFNATLWLLTDGRWKSTVDYVGFAEETQAR